MHSRLNASETLLGTLGAKIPATETAPRTLIGGLGLGFTLRSVLENAPGNARIDVAELIPEILDWNRNQLASLNGKLLGDPRVRTQATDVLRVAQDAPPGAFNSILLDIDNGPTALVSSGNSAIYSPNGLDTFFRALKPGGRLAIWSAAPDTKFERRLANTGFTPTAVPAKASANAKRAAYLIYVADKPR